MNEEELEEALDSLEESDSGFFLELLLLVLAFGGVKMLRTWADKTGVDLPERYYTTLEEIAREPSQVSRVASDTAMLEQLGLVAALAFKNKDRFTDWKSEVRSGTVDLNLPRSRVDAILRNAIQASYAAGRRAFQEGDRGLRPFLRYVAVLDERTRPAHGAMHGMVAHRDHPIWRDWTPPCGFNCRCRVVALSQEEFEQYAEQDRRNMATSASSRLAREQAILTGPDPGWGQNLGGVPSAAVSESRQTLLKTIDERLREVARKYE